MARKRNETTDQERERLLGELKKLDERRGARLLRLADKAGIADFAEAVLSAGFAEIAKHERTSKDKAAA